MYENFLEKAVLLGDFDAVEHLLSLEGIDPNYHSSFHCSLQLTVGVVKSSISC